MLNRFCCRRPAASPRRSRLRATSLGLGAALLLVAGALAGRSTAAVAGQATAGSSPARPADLLILMRITNVSGEREIGIYGAKPDPQRSGLWSVQVWDDTEGHVVIATDRIGCSAAAPMRITGSGGRLIVRELNPGGVIHPANRLDHLIWWAVCHPELAGRDPAGLAAEARRLGYSGQLPERQQVMQVPPTPRP